jgi:hypothetical protein
MSKRDTQNEVRIRALTAAIETGSMSKDDIVFEIDCRISELREKGREVVQVSERIDELRVFKRWVLRKG